MLESKNNEANSPKNKNTTNKSKQEALQRGSSPCGVKKKALQVGSAFLVLLAALVFTQSAKLLPVLNKIKSSYCKQETRNSTVPKYVLYGKNQYVLYGHLKHVIAVLDRLGLERSYEINSQWDLLWAHDYPFTELKGILANLNPYQKVNHFPGTGYLTNKVDLATTKNKYIPVSYQLPQDYDLLLKDAEQYPERVFVQKNNQHRNIVEYITNPLLVGGHKFDIGVYTVITSVNPLRVYIYNGEILFRYCPEKYYPFDPTNQDKYVVGDKYLPSWEVPPLKQYHDEGFGMKNSFDAYIKSTGKNPSKIWEQVEDALSSIILQKEDYILKALTNYQYRASFFELMRFDFIVDDNLNVYLLESNMSPNLSSMKFPPNAIIYEQLLYHTFALIGIGSRFTRDKFKIKDQNTQIMAASVKHIVTNPKTCTSENCKESCEHEDCWLCLKCLSSYQLFDLLEAYREHTNKGDMKRIFPAPIKNSSTFSTSTLEGLSMKNRWISEWFHGKCLIEVSWCQ